MTALRRLRNDRALVNRHFLSESARTEVVIALYAVRVFEQSGIFDGSDRRWVVLKVMPDDKSRILFVWPRTELNDRDISSLEGPLNCMPVDEI